MDISSGGRRRFEQLLKEARERLVQTGTRNRLVHTSRFPKQGKLIDVVEEKSDDVFRMLVSDGRRMRFAHDPDARESAEKDEPVLAIASGPVDESRYTDQWLQTKLGPDKLQKKLLALAREARTLEEEQGINALYLALGFLRWYEDERSDVVREAPLILVPVSLRRNPKTSTYDLEYRGDDISTNEPLLFRLRDDFGMILPQVPEDEGWTPGSYFDAVAEVARSKPRWSIDRDGMQLGFFSFAKLLMVKDLQPEHWPTDGLSQNPILAGLLVDGFGGEADDFPKTDRLDEVFAPKDLIQVLDADASQTVVIETVRRNRNLVVQGPPGTGKSQTITNIIAAAVHDGKTVLFVAEKMAALNVVHERLKRAGLKELCLELHSRQANKKLVAEELGRTLAAMPLGEANTDAKELTEIRDRLNKVAAVMHRPIGETGFTPYRAISTLIRMSDGHFAPVSLKLEGIGRWNREKLDEVLSAADRLAAIVEKSGPKLQHPLLGVRRLDMLPMDRQRLSFALEQIAQPLQEASRAVNTVAGALDVEAPASAALSGHVASIVEHVATLSAEAVPFAARISQHGAIDRARQVADVGARYRALREENAGLFKPGALRAPVGHLRAQLVAGRSFFGRLGGAYRNGSAELASLLAVRLPKPQAGRLALLDSLEHLQQGRETLAEIGPLATEILGELWRQEDTDFAALGEAAGWLAGLLQISVGLNAARALDLRSREPSQLRILRGVVDTQTGRAVQRATEVFRELDLDVGQVFGVGDLSEIDFSTLAAHAEKWRQNIDRLDEWAQLHAAEEHLQDLAGNEVADAVASGALAPRDAKTTIRYAHAEALYRQFAAGESWATTLTAEEKSELARRFRDRETHRRKAIAEQIRNNHLARLPRGGMGAMGTIMGEIGKKRRHMAIRKLVSQAGATLQELKPVFLMSPVSIAQFLPPEAIKFDLLVIDEASQVRPEDALGAVARAGQIVVVGDKKQLPPTSFFDRAVGDIPDDEADDEAETPEPAVTGATELESILTLCEARGLQSRMLRWHYRSKHPSLIEVSNRVFYSDHSGGLITFPSPAATRESDGLSLTRVMGAYDRGGKRHNLKEAEAVAAAVARHARESPRRSLGVVTFSTAQRDAVSERLAATRLEDPDLDGFMREGIEEEFFVKSIENVQGDERDVILISVGYGPRIAGTRLDSMAFGPVSTEGGERRLNVLFTRARFRTEVFVSFSPADINLSQAKSVGARVLKQFLEFAELGDTPPAKPLDEDPDSEFEVAVAAEIRRMGFDVEHQVGSSGYKIDLAVRHPQRRERFMLAIECDGAMYHSSVWARERDRLREDVLKLQGWRVHRVWSTDWFHRRAEEVDRLRRALDTAASAIPEVPETAPEAEETTEASSDGEVTQMPAGRSELPDYEVASFAVPQAIEPHDVPIAQLAAIALRIVETEGPIHGEEIARRVAGLFDKQRTGSRIADVVSRALNLLRSTNAELLSEGEFWTTKTRRVAAVLRNRSRAPLALRKPSLLPPEEVENAIGRVLADNGALTRDELPRAVALLFGFQRTGPEFAAAIVPVMESMIGRGALVEDASGVRLR